MAIINFFLFLIAGLFMVLFWMTPFWLLYRISDLFRLIFWRMAGYRRSVVMQNLHDCFPDEPEESLEKIERATYQNLTDILTEGIKGFTMTDKQFIERYRLFNPEVIQPYFEKGQSFIAVTAHFNNWEWGASSASLQVPFGVVAFYKTLSNPYIDRLLRRTRERRGTSLVSIRETSLTFEKLKDTPTIYLMAADQNPGKPDNAIWVNFFGRETAFLHGPEKHARANNLPIVYAHIVRKKRGWYDLIIELLVDNPNDLPYGEITRRYANMLEEDIRANPGSWLWSHRRWKHRRTE